MVDNLIEAKREAELQDDELKIQYDEGYTWVVDQVRG